MSSHNYQTFGGGGILPGSSVAATHRGGNSIRYSFMKLVFYAFFLVAVAFLVLGPITALVAFIRLQVFPDGQPTMVTHPPTFPTEMRTFRLQIIPKQVSYTMTNGPFCTYNAYTYGGSSPGPRVEVDPGEQFRLVVTNNLGKDLETSTRKQNEFRYANTTSTHFHGLHVSPAGNSDNIYAQVKSKETFINEISLRTDHPSGTYFIHPHQHGSIAMQTGFAMFAPLIVRDMDMWWRSRPEEIFVVSRGGIDSGHTTSDARLAFSESEGPAQPTNSHCFPTDFILINGDPRQKQTKCDKAIRRWRIINAATDGGLSLMWKVDDTAMETCQLLLVARDGIYLSSGVPRSVKPNHDLLVVPPGGRIDFLVQRTSAGSESCRLISVNNPRIRDSLGPKTKIIEAPIAACMFEEGGLETTNKESLEGAPTSIVETFPITLPSLPEYMDDLRRYPRAERRNLEFTEFTQNFKHGQAKYGINGEPYSPIPRFSVRLDRVQEWVIINAIAGDLGPAQESHPFHLHTNHFQIIDFVGNTLNQEDYVIGEWRDTVYVPTPGNLTIRWIPKHFMGKSLLHCHISPHEDQGQSWPFEIVDRLDHV
jgi:FtsP/CotA-like multicopper oxidase with cupredoxin domain